LRPAQHLRFVLYWRPGCYSPPGGHWWPAGHWRPSRLPRRSLCFPGAHRPGLARLRRTAV